MKMLTRILFTSALLTAATTAHADTLNGTTVTGTLTGPTTGFSTSSAVVGSGIEFTNPGSLYSYTVDLSDTGLTVSEACANTSLVKCAAAPTGGFTVTLTDDAFLNGSFDSALATSIGITDFAYSLTGSTLTITGDRAVTGTDALAFSPAIAPTPEPSSLVFLGTGILGVGAAVRRRVA